MIQSSLLATPIAGKSVRQILISPTLAGWISIVARLVGVAIVIPIAFRLLSAHDTVLWMFFTTVINFQAILDFGHNTTYARYFAYARAKRSSVAGNGAPARAGSALTQKLLAPLSANVLLRIIGGSYLRVTAVLMVVAVPALSWVALAPIQASSNPPASWIAWSCVCVSLGIQTWGGRFIAVLQGFERVAVQRWIEAIMGVFTNLLAGAILLQFKNLAFAAIATALVGVAGTLAYGMAAKQAASKLTADALGAEPDPAEVDAARKQIWAASWRSGIGILCSTGLIQSLSLLVGSFAPPQRAASFMFATRIAQVISALSQSPFYNHLPTLARKFGEHDLNAVIHEARARMLSATLIVSLGFVLVGIIVPEALVQLGSKTTFIDPVIWQMMGLAYLVERTGAMHMQLYTLGGEVIWHWVNGITGAAMLIGSVALYPAIELLSIPAAMLLSYLLIYCMISIGRSYRLLQLRFTSFDLIASAPAIAILLGYTGFSALK